MNAVAERIAGELPYPILIQGEAPKAALLETFRRTPGAVLLATASFWQGVDVVGEQLIADYPRLTEALRRRRVEAAEADRFVERLFGLELTQATYDRGNAFVAGVLERAGQDGLRRLWDGPDLLPTPPEVDAPGLWLARIDL